MRTWRTANFSRTLRTPRCIAQKHELAAYHDVLLYQTTDEIFDAAKIQVQLQAAASLSIDKILDVLGLSNALTWPTRTKMRTSEGLRDHLVG